MTSTIASTATAMGAQPPRTSRASGLPRQVITRDGVEIIVTDLRPDGPVEHTVILLHGLCLGAVSWRRTTTVLRRRAGIRVICYDHRGHGWQSRTAPSHTYTHDQLAQDLADILTDLQISGPMTIAGHSMGGIAALSYLARPLEQQPVHPSGLVLVATAAGGLTESGLGRLLAAPGADTLIDLIEHAPHVLSERLIRVLAQPLCDLVTRDRKVARSLGDAFSRTPTATTLGYLRSLKNCDLRPILPAISAATTVISGARDILTPPTHSAYMAAAIPGATHIHLPTAGHMLLQEAADVVTDAILRTIDNTTAPSDSVGHRAIGTPA